MVIAKKQVPEGYRQIRAAVIRRIPNVAGNTAYMGMKLMFSIRINLGLCV
ncbi:hypothetical protein [Lacimicrobium alkaliphilum]|nr:hypothetical protein [Lacimicrobium alkaliphilum]